VGKNPHCSLIEFGSVRFGSMPVLKDEYLLKAAQVREFKFQHSSFNSSLQVCFQQEAMESRLRCAWRRSRNKL